MELHTKERMMEFGLHEPQGDNKEKRLKRWKTKHLTKTLFNDVDSRELFSFCLCQYYQGIGVALGYPALALLRPVTQTETLIILAIEREKTPNDTSTCKQLYF